MLNRHPHLEKLARYSHSESFSSSEFQDTRWRHATRPSFTRDENGGKGGAEELVLLTLSALSGVGAILLVLYPLVF